WIEELRAELWREVFILVIGAVNLLMIGPGTRFNGIGLRIVAAFRHLMPVPLGVSELAGYHRSIARYGVTATMDEYAKFRILKPRRHRALGERIPIGLVVLRDKRNGAHEQQQQEHQMTLHKLSPMGEHSARVGAAVGSSRNQDSMQESALSALIDSSGITPISI